MGVIVERWLTFMGNHPVLFGILAVLIIAFFMVEGKRNGKKVTPNELGLLVNNQHARIIDIRAANKFAISHISGSRNIPFAELKNHLDELRTIDTPVIFVCDMGLQSGAAVSLVGKSNFMRLSGGIQGYQMAGLPLATTKK